MGNATLKWQSFMMFSTNHRYINFSTILQINKQKYKYQTSFPPKKAKVSIVSMSNKKQFSGFRQSNTQITQYYGYTKNKAYFLGKPEQKTDQNSLSRQKTFRKPPSKIRLQSLDQDNTMNIRRIAKEVISLQIKKEKKSKYLQTYIKRFEEDSYSCSISSNFSSSSHEKTPTTVPQDQKVQAILKGSPLRNKYSYLLSGSQKYTIGRDHSTLLKILRALDYTIHFLRHNRNSKFCFFTDLKKHLYENSRMEVFFQHLQKLIFLDDKLFTLKWQINSKINQYDLLIQICDDRIGEERIKNTRAKIVEFLSNIHQEYLTNNKVDMFNSHGWVQNFNPNNFEIPEGNLPIHPYKIPQISRQLSKQSEFEKIRKYNNHSCSTSLNSSEVASMIFAKQPNKFIVDKISAAIIERDNRLNAQPCPERIFQIEKSILLAICSEIMKIYLSKGVHNIYKGTILECLDKNLGYKSTQLASGLQKIIHNNKIVFLKEFPTSDHNVVLQIYKENFKKIIEHFSHQ